MADMGAIGEALQKGEADATVQLVRQAMDEGVSAEDVLNQGLLKGMDVVGEQFRTSQIFIPDVIFAARAMTAAMEILQPILADKGVEPVGRIVIGTVKGDLHDIGKNLVAMMLRGAGFTVIDLGNDVPADKFVAAAKEAGKCVVGMSALLTTTMPKMAEVIKAVRDQKLKDVKVMIGGAPVTQGYADEIGADGYAGDAASAADMAKTLIRA